MTNSLIKILVTGYLLVVHSIGFSQPATDFKDQPKIKWKFKTKGPVFSSPVIDGNTAYFGCLDSTLYAVDINTGTVKWTFLTRGEIRSNVVINNNQLFLVSPHGVVYSIDKNTGKVNWRKIFDNTALFLGERKYDFADYYQCTPVVNNNIIYFGSGSSYFYAIKADDGELIWRFKANDIIHSSPVIYKDKVYFGSFDGNVYALTMQTGSLAWKFKTVGHHFFPNGEVEGSPAVSTKNGIIYIGSRDYNFYALDANSGYSNWNKKYEGGWALAATLNDSIMYVGTADEKILYAYDALNGQQLWKTDTKFDIFGGCAFTQSMVYVGTLMGKVFGIDSKTGAIRWTFVTEGYALNHEKYFKPDDTFRDDIFKYLKSPADFIGMEYALGGMYSTPAISGNLMIVTTTEGTVYCLTQ